MNDVKEVVLKETTVIDGVDYTVLAVRVCDLVSVSDAARVHIEDLGFAVKKNDLPKLLQNFECQCRVRATHFDDDVNLTHSVLRSLYSNGLLLLVNTFGYVSFADYATALDLLRAIDAEDRFVSDDDGFVRIDPALQFLVTMAVQQARMSLKDSYLETVTLFHNCDYPIQIITDHGQDMTVIVLDTGMLPIWNLS